MRVGHRMPRFSFQIRGWEVLFFLALLFPLYAGAQEPVFRKAIVMAQVTENILGDVHRLMVIRNFSGDFDAELITRGLNWTITIGNRTHARKVDVGRDYLLYLHSRIDEKDIFGQVVHELSGQAPPLPVVDGHLLGSLISPQVGVENSILVSSAPYLKRLGSDLQGRCRYDAKRRLLFFIGPMDSRDNERLAVLFDDFLDKAAISRLQEKTRMIHRIPMTVVEGWFEALEDRRAGRELSSRILACPSVEGGYDSKPKTWTACLLEAVSLFRAGRLDPELIPTYLMMLESVGVAPERETLEWLACGPDPEDCRTDPTRAAFALRLLSAHHPGEAMPTLLSALWHPHGIVQKTALSRMEHLAEDMGVIDRANLVYAIGSFIMGAVYEKPGPTEFQPFPKPGDSPYRTAVKALVGIGSGEAYDILENEFCNVDLLIGEGAVCEDKPEQMVILEALAERENHRLDAFLVRNMKHFKKRTQARVNLFVSSAEGPQDASTLIEAFKKEKKSDVRRGIAAVLAERETMSDEVKRFFLDFGLKDKNESVRLESRRALLKEYDSALIPVMVGLYIAEHFSPSKKNRARRLKDDVWEWLEYMRNFAVNRYAAEKRSKLRKAYLTAMFLLEDDVEQVRKVCLERETDEDLRAFCLSACRLNGYRCAPGDYGEIQYCRISKGGDFYWKDEHACGRRACVEIERERICEEDGLLQDGVLPDFRLSSQCYENGGSILAVCAKCPPSGGSTRTCRQADRVEFCGPSTDYQLFEEICPAGSVCREDENGDAQCMEP